MFNVLRIKCLGIKLFNVSFVFFILQFIFTNPLKAQEGISVYQIIDSSTSKPIPMAHIEIDATKSLGTVSNLNGYFNLKSLSSDETLTISCIGYNSRQITDKELKVDSIIKLTPSIYELDEIVISNIKPESLVSEAYKKINENYSLNYPILSGTLRQQVTEDNKYVSFGEAQMDAYIPPFEKIKKKNARIKINEIRISKNNVKSLKNAVITAGSVLISYPTFYFFSPSYIKKFDWSTEEVTIQNTDEVYKIKFKGKKLKDYPWNQENEGYVYISKQDKAILKVSHKKISNNFDTKSGKDILNVTNSYFYPSYEYKKNKENKYMLSYARVEWLFDLEVKNKKTKQQQQHKYVVISDYVVHNYKEGKHKGFKNADTYPFAKVRDEKAVDDWGKFKIILPDYEKKSILS